MFKEKRDTLLQYLRLIKRKQECTPMHLMTCEYTARLAVHNPDLRKSCSPAAYPMHYKPQASANHFASVTK